MASKMHNTCGYLGCILSPEAYHLEEIMLKESLLAVNADFQNRSAVMALKIRFLALLELSRLSSLSGSISS